MPAAAANVAELLTSPSTRILTTSLPPLIMPLLVTVPPAVKYTVHMPAAALWTSPRLTSVPLEVSIRTALP